MGENSKTKGCVTEWVQVLELPASLRQTSVILHGLYHRAVCGNSRFIPSYQCSHVNSSERQVWTWCWLNDPSKEMNFKMLTFLCRRPQLNVTTVVCVELCKTEFSCNEVLDISSWQADTGTIHTAHELNQVTENPNRQKQQWRSVVIRG